jgi:hypothetical protein
MSSIYARLGESRSGIIAAFGFVLQQGVESTVEAIDGLQRPTACGGWFDVKRWPGRVGTLGISRRQPRDS